MLFLRAKPSSNLWWLIEIKEANRWETSLQKMATNPTLSNQSSSPVIKFSDILQRIYCPYSSYSHVLSILNLSKFPCD